LTARWIGPCRHFCTFAVGVPHRRKALDFADRIDHFKEVCMEMDVFIAHASEDKDAVARPLAAELRRQGFRVWYDEYSLRVGDSLNEKINDGLAVATFGVIIISPNFIEKEWPQRELNGLLAVDEGERHGHILPIWHNVTAAQVKAWNPIMADRVATSTSKGLPAVVADIAAVLQGIEAPSLPAAVLPRETAQRVTVSADDSRDLVERARVAFPRQTGMGVGTGTLVLSVSAGPSAVLLRPTELRDATTGQRLLEQAVMGNPAVLDLANATRIEREGSQIALRQNDAFVTVDSRGTVVVGGPAREDTRQGLPAIIEEVVRDRLERAIRFVGRVLDQIDGQGGLTHVALCAGLLGAGAFGWRTRAEHQASPNSMTMAPGLMRGGAEPIVQLDPPVRPRTALGLEASSLAEDLTVLLGDAVNK
jgi:hypothetical protein